MTSAKLLLCDATRLPGQMDSDRPLSWRNLICRFNYQMMVVEDQIVSMRKSEKEKGRLNKRRNETTRRNWWKLNLMGAEIMMTLASPPPGLWPDTLAILANFRGGLKVFLNSDYYSGGVCQGNDFFVTKLLPLIQLGKAVEKELRFFWFCEHHGGGES